MQEKEDAGLAARIELALLYAVYARQRHGMAMQVLGTAATTAYAWNSSIHNLGYWALCQFSYAALAFVMETRFRRSQPQADRLQWWRYVFVGQCILSGAAWTTILTINMVGVKTADAVLLITMLMGVSAGALSVLHQQRLALWAFLISLMAPPALAMLVLGTPDQYFSAMALLTCLVIFMILGHDMHLAARRQLQVQFAMEAAFLQADAAKQQAEAANAAKSRFLATMSHELRTPMNAVLGMMQLVQSTELSERQRGYLGKMHGAARALLALLNAVLDFSKLDAGRLNVDKQPFVLSKVLQDVADILVGTARDKAIRINFSMDSRSPQYLVGDDQLLHQVLLNLAGNAVKFTAVGEVLVSVRLISRSEQTARLQFSVKDTGIGIAPEHQKVIFDAFVQAESSTTRRFGGTGLGLAICRQLVNLMGGSLQVQSQLGEGSTFWFELELALAPHPVVAALAGSHRPDTLSPDIAAGQEPGRLQRLQGLRILLAEDNVLNQQVASELLAQEGAVVHAVSNGEEAVQMLVKHGEQEAAQEVAFDLVLMDMHMPVLDGLAATRQIRRQPALQGLPILAMTANALPADRQACLDAGMNGYVGKPFTIQALVEAILGVLNR